MAGKSISRRSFVAAGSTTIASSLLLSSLPGAEDAFALLAGARQAHASEADADARDSTDVVVVGRTQVGIVAYDVSDPQNPTPVPKCKVTLTSRATNATVSDTADDKGRVTLDIAELAEDKNASILAFNGRIEVSHEGYRDVVIPLARILAHTAIVAPTRPLDGKPYFRALSMNEWDVQYSEQTFLTSGESTEDQLIEGELWMPDGRATPDAVLVFVRDGVRTEHGAFTHVQTRGQLATLKRSGKFLLSGDADCMESGTRARVDFGISGADARWWCALGVETKPAPLAQNERDSTIVIPDTASSRLNFLRFPDTFVPPIGGASVSMWKPSFPVMFDFSPFGYGMLGWGFQSISAKDDKGNYFSPSSWHKVPVGSVEDQCGVEFDLQMKELDRYDAMKASMTDGDKTKHVAHECTSKFKIIFDVQAFAALKYTWSKELWEGSLSALAAAKFDFNWTHYLNLFGVPVFLIINPWLRFNASLRLGVTMKELLSFDYEPEDATLGVGANVGIALTFGVGVNNFLSLSITGSGYISGFINFAPNPGHSWPRYLGGYGYSGVVTAQFSFFKYTYPIWNENKPDALDSNDDAQAALQAVPLEKRKLDAVLQSRLGAIGMRECVPASTAGLPGFDELKENAVLVTNAEMLRSKEFSVAKAADASAVSVRVEEAPCSLGAAGDGVFPDIVVVSGRDVANGETEAGAGLPVYDYVGAMEAGGADLTLGVEGFSDGRLGGVRPSVDALLFKKVNSNPCMKLLVTQTTGLTMLFRIAIVDVGGGRARPRLVYHMLDSKGAWSAPNVVNFDPHIDGVERDDMYDFEFDVTQAEGNGGHNYVCAIVTSGTRPAGDATTLVDGIQAHYVSLACLVDTYTTTDRFKAEPSMCVGIHEVGDGATLLTPRITGYSDVRSIAGTQDFCLMGTFVRSRVDEQDGVDAQGDPIMYFARWEMNSNYSQKVFTVTRTKFNNLDGIDYVYRPVRIDDDTYDHDWEYGSVAACRRATVACVDGNWLTINKMEACYDKHDSSKFATFSDTCLASVGGPNGMHVSRAYPWHDDGELLATVKGKSDAGYDVSTLYHVRFDPKNKGEATFTQIGPSEGAAADFVVDPKSHFLFYVQNVDGKVGQTYGKDGRVTGDVVEHHHYIMAVAQVEGMFTKPFVFCELDHVIDDLVSTTVDERYVNFLAGSITDIDSSQASIYDVRVPLLKCLTPVALVAVDDFAFAGEECEFSVDVRNDGNLVARGARFTLCDADGAQVGSVYVDFAEYAAQHAGEGGDGAFARSAAGGGGAGAYDVDALPLSMRENPLVANDGAGVLVPGDTASYKVSYTIPETWKDTKTVRVALSDVDVVNPTGATPGRFQSFHEPTPSCPAEQLEIRGVGVDGEGLASGEVHESAGGEEGGAEKDGGTEKGDAPGDKAPGGDAPGDGAGAHADKKLDENAPGGDAPDMGDLGLFGLGALAAGALGAGFAAYSARRSRLEKEAASPSEDAGSHDARHA